MKKLTLAGWLATLSLIMTGFAFAETKITEKMDGDEDSSILIQKKKNPSLLERDFEFVSDSEEVSGEPETGWKAAHSSWKQACAEWKKEVRENNKGSQILSLNCGKAEQVKDPTNNGVYTYRSEGKFKIRVRIKGDK